MNIEENIEKDNLTKQIAFLREELAGAQRQLGILVNENYKTLCENEKYKKLAWVWLNHSISLEVKSERLIPYSIWQWEKYGEDEIVRQAKEILEKQGMQLTITRRSE